MSLLNIGYDYSTPIQLSIRREATRIPTRLIIRVDFLLTQLVVYFRRSSRHGFLVKFSEWLLHAFYHTRFTPCFTRYGLLPQYRSTRIPIISFGLYASTYL